MKALVKERTFQEQEFDHIEEITFGDELAKGKISFTGPTITVEHNGLIMIKRPPEDKPVYFEEQNIWAFKAKLDMDVRPDWCVKEQDLR